MSEARRLVAVGLKSYLSARSTRAWLEVVAAGYPAYADRLDLVVFPPTPLVPMTVAAAEHGGFGVGAQQVSAHPAGAFTGETPASLLAELGVRYAEIGHAERRFLFGDQPGSLREQVSQAQEHSLVPLVCVGEGTLGDTTVPSLANAVGGSIAQLEQVLDVLEPARPCVIAYEPVWAIGADSPASPDHVHAVAAALREALASHPHARLVYGGTAGPGVFAALADVLDGLFLGRRAHDPNALGAVLAELATG